MTDIIVRSATPGELVEYVMPTWLKSYALGLLGKWMRADSRHGVGRDAYWSEQRAKIDSILSTNSTRVRVAVLDNELIGWVCDDEVRRRVHYLFVNRVFRQQGVAKLLLPAWWDDPRGGPVYFSHLPPPWFTQRGRGGEVPPWPGHVCIDLIGT